MKKTILFSVAFLFVSYAFSQSAGPKNYAALIDSIQMQPILYRLASDEFEGRETAAKGQKLAANYIASKFFEYGVAPKGDSAYFQKFLLENSSMKSCEIKLKGVPFKKGKNYHAYPVSRSVNINASKLVLLGDSLKNNDLLPDGSIVLLFSKKNKEGKERPNLARLRDLKKKKPSAIFVLVSDESFVKEFYLKPTSSRLGAVNEGEQPTPVFMITEKAMEKILTKTKTPESIAVLKEKAKSDQQYIFELNRAMSLSISNDVEGLTSENVLGWVEGSDKKEEYIFITAHYDHLGKRSNGIYYGADDNASGTAAILEMSKAFQKAKNEGMGPRRSLVFMAMSGEEKGLLGSEHYVTNPIVPLKNIMTNLNIDMIGRIDEKHAAEPNYIYLIGSTKLSSALHKVSEEVNAKYCNFVLDYTYDAPDDPNRFYYRSDHYNFAKNNIPVIFYFNGMHADYHKTSDTADKIRLGLMEKRTQLVFYTAWELANREESIQLDMPSEIKKP